MKAWLKQQAVEWIEAFWKAFCIAVTIGAAGFMLAYGATKGYQAAVENVSVVDENGCELAFYVPLTGITYGEGCDETE
ncbi:hypothetical protein [Marinobacterium sp. MBR-109]|jgi:hypothetical protein|uniref:hypothetical protein n=1 Tax=Marinobacterium sp. MBR-109 TaxID=3156462 RepID=UPI00339597F4